MTPVIALPPNLELVKLKALLHGLVRLLVGEGIVDSSELEVAVEDEAGED